MLFQPELVDRDFFPFVQESGQSAPVAGEEEWPNKLLDPPNVRVKACVRIDAAALLQVIACFLRLVELPHGDLHIQILQLIFIQPAPRAFQSMCCKVTEMFNGFYRPNFWRPAIPLNH